MTRTPCCEKAEVRKGPWTREEDELLVKAIKEHGEGNWSAIPKKAGLIRCGKSCRLRWANYLRPDLKRGAFSAEEEALIVRLHKEMGNRWAKIALELPGRTDNDIKNHWNTRIKKKLRESGIDPETHLPLATRLADGMALHAIKRPLPATTMPMASAYPLPPSKKQCLEPSATAAVPACAISPPHAQAQAPLCPPTAFAAEIVSTADEVKADLALLQVESASAQAQRGMGFRSSSCSSSDEDEEGDSDADLTAFDHLPQPLSDSHLTLHSVMDGSDSQRLGGAMSRCEGLGSAGVGSGAAAAGELVPMALVSPPLPGTVPLSSGALDGLTLEMDESIRMGLGREEMGDAVKADLGEDVGEEDVGLDAAMCLSPEEFDSFDLGLPPGVCPSPMPAFTGSIFAHAAVTTPVAASASAAPAASPASAAPVADSGIRCGQ
ncbi:unnamed protein product [Closterium sp. NIES-64]|nr:unnamed protein product [Closterium sp. NIES-64]CAI5990845.1 unnamed protein product [Closterium sp. NIES-64]